MDIEVGMVKDDVAQRGEFIKKPFHGKVYFIDKKAESIMTIQFGRYFEFGSVYENFKMSLSSKRTFNRSIVDIADDNNRVLSHSFHESTIDTDSGVRTKTTYNDHSQITNEFLLSYLGLKMNIDDAGELTKFDYVVFISELMNLLNDNFLKLAFNYVDSVYLGSMDELIDSEKEKRTFGSATTFVDIEIKQFCHVKYIGNLLVPLCTHYCNIMARDVNPKDFFLDFYKALFERISRLSGVNAIDKLHRYVTMIVSSSFKSNKAIYDRMGINGTTKDSEVEEVFSKILTTIITKLDPTDTIPAFIAETVKRSSSQYKPREDDGYSILTGFSDDYVHSGSDDSVVTEAERMESKIARPDELLKVVRKNSCDDTINKLSIRYGVYIDSHEEYLYTMHNMDLHEYQTNIMFQSFSHIYGGFENMYDNSRHNYCRLLILVDKYLRSVGCEIIADYVTARCAGYSFQQRWSGKVSDRKLFEDPRYLELLDGKYRYSRAQFERNNFIRNNIVLLANTRFHYNRYGDPRGGQLIKHTDDELIDAVLNYYLKVVV